MTEETSLKETESSTQTKDKPTTQELVTVTFPSEDNSIEVPSGASVLDAAIAAGVFINSVCGGMGRCGKCKIIAKGSFEADKSELISEEEKELGMSLACTTRVLGDTEIEIPSTSKVDIHQILTRTDLVHVEKTNPLINNYHLQMKEPTLDDNVSDFYRLRHALVSTINSDSLKVEDITAPVSIIRKLPDLLRMNDWDVTVTTA